MKTLLALLLFTAASAAAQAPKPSVDPARAITPQATCAECGVVRTVRSVNKEVPRTPADETKPSGLVATVPLGGGKPQIGSSTRLGKETPNVITTWEVIVRLDDGRFQLIKLDEPPEVREGDKVRIDEGKIVLRTN